MKLKSFLGILSIAIFLFFAQTAGAKMIYPVQTDELLKNPGTGWMTMFKPAISDSNLPSDIPSTLYYVRINWEQVHTGPDQYNFAPLDSAVVNALKGGQQVMIRLMPVWEGGQSPQWMKNAGYQGYDCAGHWSADLNDTRVQSHISKLLQEMGKRYDYNPGVHSMEINFLGMYGEGHFYECSNVPMPSTATQKWLVDEHYKYFPHLPIIGPIHVQEPEQQTAIIMYRDYGQTRGAGIFFDGWGDAAHDNTKYPAWLKKITGQQTPDIWQKGIMKLEPSGTMYGWQSNIPTALQWALDYHGTFIGNKDAAFPTAYKDQIKTALKKLGYNFVLKEAEYADSVAPGANMSLRLAVDNIGVAPPYRDYYFAIQLRNSSGQAVQTYVSQQSVKFWLPGRNNATLSVPLLANLAQGTYTLALAIVNEFDSKPAILMSIQGRESTGWHSLGTIQLGGTTQPPATKKGDLNNDNKIDIIDLGIFLSNWGVTTKPASDLNQDGKVDIIDLGILLSNWG